MNTDRSVALATLLRRLPAATVQGDLDRTVTAIVADSRAARTGALFVALPGSVEDGHRYVPGAIAGGARSIVVEASFAAATPPDVAVVRVADTRRALSALAAAFYGDPSHALDVIGVTGTNGKTTVTRMVAAILNEAAIPCGTIGTVGAAFGLQTWRLENTTPLPPELHALLARMRDEGARAVAMEVSSHALALGRVEDVRFRAAVLTNVTRDHLDFHQTVDAYAAAKRRLLSLAPTIVINADDEYGERWAVEASDEGREVIAYGNRDGATLAPADIVLQSHGSQFTLGGQRYTLPIPGRFNIWNALGAIGAARCLGVEDAVIARGLAALNPIPGRMERVGSGDVEVVVDYAHTPDALESALRSLRETAGGALVVVFGCGGDRDKGKRAEMGAVAARLADRLYITSDNSRSEEPRAIVDAILAGVGAREHVVELDRRRAIERAISQARPGDVVLVAGKGHEDYQIVGTRVLPFDDAAISREALAARTVLR